MSVRTNQDRLVMQCVMGEIQHPTVKELPVRIDCEGRVHTLPNTGSIVYNVRLGDSVYGLAGDHIEPGVTIKNYRSGSENAALNILSCIGNEAVVVSGDAKGAKGFVTGTHGGVEHVLLYFPREDLERMTIGDRIQIRALGQGLELEEVWPPSDLEMMEKIVPMFVSEDKFMVYCLTVSGHLTYTQDTNAMSARHWEEVSGLPYSEEVRCYLAAQMELELAMESLLSQLEEAGKLNDTVVVLSADHYPYGLTDEQYSELLGHEVDPVFEIFQNTLILWSGDMEGAAVHVDKYCSSLDVMPTLSNLFGLEYDSRLLMGQDILSDAPGLVIFSVFSEIFILGTNAPSSFWMAASLYTPPKDGLSLEVIRFVPTPQEVIFAP